MSTPETIYLIPGEYEEGLVWCDDPAPDSYSDPDEAVKYVRADTLPVVTDNGKVNVGLIAENERLQARVADLEQAVSVPEWTDINLRQPEEYQDVLWFCQGGNIRTGMYYGKTHCDRVPETHPISRRGRSHYGKFGRYADPAESGHVVTHWMPLPQPPKQEQGQ